MNQTNVDDVYINMIAKEVEKIDEKFAKGESLNHTDIHTLVIKTQYNHINHLNLKLDEVASSVKELEHKFENHKIEINAKFETLEQKFETHKIEIKNEINQAIITQTKWLISGAGVLVITMKILDIFVK
jgi:hypothetical protein